KTPENNPVQPVQQPQQQQKPVEKPVEREKKPGIFSKIKGKLEQYKRTIEVARKPNKEEFMSSIKITGLGILLLGFIGFIIYMIYHLVF
ncbi:MAG: protein translocase SEC61 complex subunit gamma, partial [Candidatus Aenigmarchaeota archaeon]|nr:protein translocase SEC61 complex subunit gamma [Candidatus Aenigmarchaeota archaeon]